MTERTGEQGLRTIEEMVVKESIRVGSFKLLTELAARC